MTWTPEREAELEKFWKAGCHASQIGKWLGVSKNAVVGKAHRMKLEPRPNPTARVKKLRPPLSAKTRGWTTPRPSQELSSKSPAKKTKKKKPPSEMATRAPNHGEPAPRGKCLWPIGDPKEDDFRFCNEDQLPGKPYCEAHDRKAHKQPSAQEEAFV